jgi:endonuclease I
MAFICDCKSKLSLRLLTNNWFKIYDATEIERRKNQRAREIRKFNRNPLATEL